MPPVTQQATFYDPEGRPIPLEELGDALARGEAAPQKGAKVSVRRGEGAPVWVDSEELPRLVKEGYSIEDPAAVERRETIRAYNKPGQAALAAVEGVGSGLTMGLGPAALTEALGEDYRKGAAARREANPLLYGGGQVAGALAPLALSGGSSAGAQAVKAAGALPRGAAAVGRGAETLAATGLRAAGYAGETALGRIGARVLTEAAGAGAEGALWGAGQAVEDAFLQDTELTTEKLLAGAGHGALWGAGAGGAFGLGGGILSEGARGLSKVAGPLKLPGMPEGLGTKTVRELAEDTAEKRAVDAISGNYKKYHDDLIRRGGGIDAQGNRIGRKLLDADISIGNPTKAIDELAAKADDAVSRMEGVAKRLESAEVTIDAEGMLSRVDDQIAALRAADDPDLHKIAAKLEKKTALIRQKVYPPEPRPAKGPTTREVDTGLVDARGNAIKRTVDVPGVPGEAVTPPKEYGFREFWELRQQFDKGVKWTKLRAEGATETEKALAQLRSTYDDALTDAIEAQGDDALASTWKQAKEDYGDFLSAKRAAENLAESRAKNRTVSLTDYISGVAGTVASISTGNVLPLVGAGAAALGNKVLRERGSAWVAKLADRIAKSDAVLEKAADAFASVRSGPLKLPRLPSDLGRRAVAPAALAGKRLAAAYQARAEQVQSVQRDPELSSRSLAQAVSGIDHPDIAAEVVAQAIRANDYLASQLPRTLSRESYSLTPFVEEAYVQPAEMRRFVRVFDAVSEPLEALTEMAGKGVGAVNVDVVNAIKATYPRIWQDLRTAVATKAATSEKPLTFNRRMLIGLVFDLPTDRSLNREYIQAMQAYHQPAEQEPSRPQRRGARLPEDFGANLQTKTEKLASAI